MNTGRKSFDNRNTPKKIAISNGVELFIDKIVTGGRGISKSRGHPVFVSGVIDGETVDAKITEKKKNYSAGVAAAIVKSSCHRINPPCKYHFSTEKKPDNYCGGCSWQHIEYSHQLQLKKEILADTLSRVGKFRAPDIDVIEPSDNVFRYRNKAQIPVAFRNGRLATGFFMSRSHRIIDIDDCLIQPEVVFKISNFVKKNLAKIGLAPYNEDTGEGSLRHIFVRVGSSGGVLAGFVARQFDERYETLASEVALNFPEVRGVVFNENSDATNVIFGRRWEKFVGDSFLIEEIASAGIKLKISYGAFFQVNSGVASKIYSFVADRFRETDCENLLDLYSGVGGFGLSAAKYVRSVIGVEENQISVMDAVSNARLNDVTNARFFAVSAENYLKSVRRKKKSGVILDPPRTGVSWGVINGIKRMAPEIIVYVSCDAATFSRDVRILVDGGYKITSIKPFDMFPQTPHFEIVAILRSLKNKM